MRGADTGREATAWADRSVSIVVASGDLLFASALRGVIAIAPELQLLGQAVDGRHAVQLIGELRPAVAVLDTALAIVDWLAVVGQVDLRRTRVLCMAARVDAELARTALAAGASGVLATTATGGQIRRALATVAQGDQVLPAELTALEAEAIRRRHHG